MKDGTPGRIVRITCSSLFLLLALGTVSSTLAEGLRQITDSLGTSVGAVAISNAKVVTVTNQPPATEPGRAFQVRLTNIDGSSPSPITAFRDSVEPRTELIDVSADGQWIAFASQADPLGSNVDRSRELFVIAADGSDLAQLTDDPAPLAGEVRELAISGDGTSLVFVSTSDLTGGNSQGLPLPFRVDRDGSGLKQITPSPIGAAPMPGVRSVSISTDGSRVAFFSTDDIDGSNPTFAGRIYRAAGDGSSFSVWLADLGVAPRVSGDGGTIAFLSSFDLVGANPGNHRQIFADDWAPGTLSQVTSLSSDVIEFDLDASATAYGLLSRSDDLGSNPDGNVELFSVTGGSLNQETDTTSGGCRDLRLSEDGSRAVMLCDGDDPFFGGGNPDTSLEAITVLLGGGPDRVTDSLNVAARAIDLSLDASRVLVVSSRDDPLDSSSPVGGGLFLIANEVSPTLLTSSVNDPGTPAAIAGDASVVAYVDSRVTAGNPDGSAELYVVPGGGGTATQLTFAPGGSQVLQPDLDRTGSRVVFTSNADLTGANPSHRLQVFAISTGGTGLQQLSAASLGAFNPRINLDGTHVTYLSDNRIELRELTSPVSIVIDGSVSAPLGGTVPPDISDDARFVVYADADDPLGSNPEGNVELFRYDLDTGTLDQLTATTDGANTGPVFSGDRRWIWFYSSSPWFENDPARPFWLYRLSTISLDVERIGGLGFGRAPLLVADYRVDDSGNRGVFYDFGDPTGANDDRQSDAFLIDTQRMVSLRVLDAVATRIEWTAGAGPLRYDVARGDLGALSGDGVGGTDLGALTCIEDDSPDLDTRWLEDTETPAASTGYFYVVRGAAGLDAPPGSYGRASTGGERSASGITDCPP